MEWKRIHFFKGFFTHAEDWRAAQSYRSAKHHLHHRALHGWGIVHGYLESLEVDVSSDGTTLLIEPGLAIDPEGRELCLSEPETVLFEPEAHPRGAHLYLVIRYEEEPIDRRENVANPEYSGYAFIREFARVELTPTAPGADGAVELARVHLSGRATRLRMPADPMAPQPDEIDRRHRRDVSRRTTWQEFVQPIADGEVNVRAKTRSSVLIEEVAAGEPARFYLASCEPLVDAPMTADATGEKGIAWRIMSRKATREQIEYALDIENFASHDERVRFRVYRLA